jgi:site-specific DNA-methyltransferase (adenine-specific)
MKYPDDFINKIICGDCLEVMKDIPDKSVDLVLTDPPYGLNKKIHDGGTWSTKQKFDACLEWDYLIDKSYWEEVFRISKHQIIWGGNYYSFPPSRGWIVWVKPYFPTMSDAELAWTSFDKNTRIFKESRNPEGYKKHPTQKPVSLMKYCIENYTKPDDIILDPFLGSGTTAVACKSLGRRYIGIEISQEYCDIARKRVNATPEPLFV